MENIIIVPMAATEAKEVVKLGRKTFRSFESLWISHPHTAMVAKLDGIIVGAILYKYFQSGNKKIGYIDYIFVDERFHGQGIGKSLYDQTLSILWDEGCDALSAIVKDDHVASWSLLEKNGFLRVSFSELIHQFGLMGTMKHYFSTPLFVSIGMNYYVCNKAGNHHKRESHSILQLFYFLIINLFLLSITNGYSISWTTLMSLLGAYASILFLHFLTTYLGTRFSRQRAWQFRLNQGGLIICGLIHLTGILPMIGNWYPKDYEKDASFKSDMGKVALVGWIFLLMTTLLTSQMTTDSLYLRTLSQMGAILLIYHSIPVYPFESYGGGRIFSWNKLLFSLLAFVSLLLAFSILI